MVAKIERDEPQTDRPDRVIVNRALERWKACQEWQGTEDERTREDIKFANGDPRNRWQWPDDVYNQRTSDGSDLPCLTINNTRVHNDMIINAMSKNAYGVKIRPTGGKASYESAKVMQALVQRVEYISKASSQYRKVAEHQVDGGIGYIVISTDYVSERSFDQEIYLKAATDPTAVYLDPWIKEPDGSDAMFGFEFEKMSRKTFNRKYPAWKDRVGAAPLDSAFMSWLTDKEIVLCKYWEKEQIKDLLVGFTDEDGNETIKLRSELKADSGKEIYKRLLEQIDNGEIDGQTRSVMRNNVRWYLIGGSELIDDGEWAGKYIPICRCVGRETVIDGTLDRKGHTRPLINAQHMLNYSASVAVETAALAPKSQWIGPARAFEGMEGWKDANVKKYAYLQYNDVDDEAPVEMQKIDAPQRLDPPRPNPAAQQGMQDAERQMMMISGQFEAQMGENDTQSAASGKAIGERKEQGDTATYHFPEHMSDMKRFIGVQLIDLIPKIYDTKRTLAIMDERQEKRWIMIDPTLPSATQDLEHESEDEEAVKMAFNPSVGEYECVSDPGPSYATQRQEAWQAFSLIMQQNQWVASCAADLLFKVGDFPGAEELMERLQKEIKAVKPYLFDNDKDPPMLAAQQQMQKLTALNAELMQKLANKELQIRGRDEKRDIDASNAETNRIKVMIEALARLALTPQQKAQMEHEIAMQSHDHIAGMITATNQNELDMQKDAASAANEPADSGASA